MYSNVTPPTLPEWDSNGYPYYVLVFTYGKGDTDWHGCSIYYMAVPFVYNDGGYVTGAAETFGYRGYKTSTETWEYWLNGEEFQQPGTALELIPGIVGGNYQRIYTNHDIKDGAGNTWLAAGSITEAVETVTEKWLRSFQTGLALGLAGKPLPIKKEPVAYLYNGVRLPKLPEWDKEKYPYAYIHHSANLSDTHTLYVSSTPAVYNDHADDLNDGWIVYPADKYWLHFSDSTEWAERNHYGDDGQFIDLPNATYAYRPICDWCNTSMIRPDETVDFVATTPIPVYE